MDYNYIIVAIIFIGFDIISGILQSLINGTFESKKMRIGGLHKLFLLVVIAFGVALDFSQDMVNLGFSIPALKMICVYVTLMEVMSCVENVNAGFPNALPKPLVSTLKQVAKENGYEEKEQKEGE